MAFLKSFIALLKDRWSISSRMRRPRSWLIATIISILSSISFDRSGSSSERSTEIATRTSMTSVLRRSPVNAPIAEMNPTPAAVDPCRSSIRTRFNTGRPPGPFASATCCSCAAASDSAGGPSCRPARSTPVRALLCQTVPGYPSTTAPPGAPTDLAIALGLPPPLKTVAPKERLEPAQLRWLTDPLVRNANQLPAPQTIEAVSETNPLPGSDVEAQPLQGRSASIPLSLCAAHVSSPTSSDAIFE